MAYQARWKGIKIKVTHTIRADNHRCFLFVESIDNGLQSIFWGIKIITIQLNSKATAMRIIDSIVPTATYTEVSTCRNKMHKTLINSQWRKALRCSICRMIVDNDNVKRKICLLWEGRNHRIAHRLLTIKDRNHHWRLHRKSLSREVWLCILRCIYQGIDSREVCCCCLLHLNLYLTVAWIHIIKLLLTTCT